jgi:hypothetical protein
VNARSPLVVNDYSEVLGEAFAVLDRYFGEIANRDPVKSLDEDRCDLLRRVRTALEPLVYEGDVRRDDVAKITQRIDDLLITECAVGPAAVPRMYRG